jgi:hypothetical protein
MDTSKGFGKVETFLKIIPASLFLLFLYIEMHDRLTVEYKIGWYEFILLMLILSYPVGTIFQQFAITIREFCLRNTRYSIHVYDGIYLRNGVEEFWTRYIRLYSEANPRLIGMIESMNLNKFFFLNMAFVTILSLIIHISLTGQYLNYIPIMQAILAIAFIKFHLQSSDHFLYVFDLATIPAKKLNRISSFRFTPLPPKPPKLPK